MKEQKKKRKKEIRELYNSNNFMLLTEDITVNLLLIIRLSLLINGPGIQLQYCSILMHNNYT